MAALASACGSDERAPTPSVAPSLPEPTREEAPVTGAGAAGAGGALGEDVPPEDTPLVPAPELEPEVLTPNASGYVWRPVVMGGGGFVSGIVTSRAQPGLVFARTDVGGAYRWSESTESWVALMDWIDESQKGFWGVESLAIDPSDPSRVYLLVGIEYFNSGRSAILTSDDGGRSFSVHDVTAQFTAHGNGLGRQSGERLAVDPEGGALYCGTRKNGLFRSLDRGATWARLPALDVTTTPNGNGVAFVVFEPSSPVVEGLAQRLYVGVSRSGEPNLYVSVDAGATFTPVPDAPVAFTPQRASFDDAGSLYITYGNGAGPYGTPSDPMDRGAVWKLDTRAGVWTDISPLTGEAARAFGGVSVAPDGSRLLVSTINTYQQQPWGYGDRLFSSDDGGATWVDLIASGRVAMDTNGFEWMENNAIHWAGSFELDPFDLERAWVTSGNGVFMTENLSGAPSVWKVAGEGLEETVPLDAVSVPGGPLVSVVGDYDGFVHDALDVPPRARHTPTMGTTTGLAVASAAPGVLARVGAELYLSEDGARTWALVPRPTDDTNGRLALAADGSVLLWSSGTASYRTIDRGQSWSPVSGLDFEAALAADAVLPTTFYAYDRTSGVFAVSEDGGASFTPRATLAAGGALRSRAVPGSPGEVWVALAARGLARTLDAGASFEPIAAVQEADAVGFGAPAPGASAPAVYVWGRAASGPRGVYRSDDAGASWLRVNDDEHQYGGPGNGELVIGDANVYGRVFMSTAGRGLVYGEIAPSAE